MNDGLLTIGRFARLCRLSVKQLRHYDETGVLRPARVDGATGYRYYAPEQARDALTVSLLRDLDVPLAVIREALAADAAGRRGILQGERDRLAERIARDEVRLGMLDRLADGRLPGYEVRLTDEPARRLAVVRARTTADGIAETVGVGIGQLMGALGGTGRWVPPLWGLYPLDLGDGMRIAVGAELTDAAGPPPGTDPEALPACRVAEAVHHGPYAQLPLAYNALFAWVHERGLDPRGPAREAYVVGPGEAEPEELVTRVLLPVEETRVLLPVEEER
ncbi:MerR family transcriptional regulator [Streptomyces sp. NPDC051940]|uniref:MerR family transcriptional regulator n=1 Tax=Streptomyces sp. NPDC051940 TaxID=3155675 RepID=UPI00344689EE